MRCRLGPAGSGSVQYSSQTLTATRWFKARGYPLEPTEIGRVQLASGVHGPMQQGAIQMLDALLVPADEGRALCNSSQMADGHAGKE